MDKGLFYFHEQFTHVEITANDLEHMLLSKDIYNQYTTSPNKQQMQNKFKVKKIFYYIYFLSWNMLCIFFNGVFLEKKIFIQIDDSNVADFFFLMRYSIIDAFGCKWRVVTLKSDPKFKTY